MKRIVRLFVIVIGTAIATSVSAHAQRSGSMQVTARVVDTRESWAGLNSARTVASRLANSTSQSNATVETALAQVSVQLTNRGEMLDRPRAASITINYLRI